MRLNHALRAIGAILVLAPAADSHGGIVGYINYSFEPGGNLFVNNLETTTNRLSQIIPAPPDGTTVSIWDPGTSTYTTTSSFISGAWTMDLVLAPGDAARLHNPSAAYFVNTFVGTVVNGDGTPFDGTTWVMPAPFADPAGVYLLGSAIPLAFPATAGYDVAFMHVLGRPPLPGEQFTSLDAATQTTSTTTYLATGWDNGSPELSVGEAGFFTLVPEPHMALIFGPLVLFARRRRAVDAA